MKYSNEERFTKELDIWYLKYKEFIEKRTTNNETGKKFYTHQKTRLAYRSLKANLAYLFTYKNQKNLK